MCSDELLGGPRAEFSGARSFDDCLYRARQGCREALGELQDRCRRYLLLVANEEFDQELRAKFGPSDIVQDTLLKVQQRLSQFAGTTDAELRRWTRAILLNNLRDMERRFQPGTKRDLQRECDLHAILADHADARKLITRETPSRQVMDREQADALQAALARLSNEDRQVLMLRNIQRQSFVEIGVSMGRSADATRKLWLRAIERLRGLLGVGDDDG